MKGGRGSGGEEDVAWVECWCNLDSWVGVSACKEASQPSVIPNSRFLTLSSSSGGRTCGVLYVIMNWYFVFPFLLRLLTIRVEVWLWRFKSFKFNWKVISRTKADVLHSKLVREVVWKEGRKRLGGREGQEVERYRGWKWNGRERDESLDSEWIFWTERERERAEWR